VELHPAVAERLARLAPDQRAAATAPPGPSLCIAPAGSGKTTTLVARAAWLIATGTPPDRIRAITFNKRAAVEMTERLDAALAPLDVEPGAVRVRTFHALGREILRDANVAVDPLVDRAATLADVAPWADAADLRRLDTVISRLKVDLGVGAAEVAADPEAGRFGRAFVDYESAVRATGGLDFDDLILRAIERLDGDATLLARWRSRCAELLVDEVQDVDRAQLRLALLLAAPANRIFLVGDDDQSIYGWRLADVRASVYRIRPTAPGRCTTLRSGWRRTASSARTQRWQSRAFAQTQRRATDWPSRRSVSTRSIESMSMISMVPRLYPRFPRAGTPT